MEEYEKYVRSVIDYLTQNHYCSSLIRANERCLQKLGSYLEQHGWDYSPQRAEKWADHFKDQFPKSQKVHYKMALLRIRDIYECGYIRTEHDSRHWKSYTVINESLKESLDSFLRKQAETLSPDTVRNHKQACARFLIFAQQRGAKTIHDITFELICQFYSSDVHEGCAEKHHSNSSVAAMMSFFFEQGIAPYGFTIIFHYLSHGKIPGCYWNDVSVITHRRIAEALNFPDTVTTNTLRRYKEKMEQLHRENAYSKSMVCSYRKAADLLILFLEMNGYPYNPKIAWFWFEDIRHYFGIRADLMRRSLCMIEEYHRSSHISLDAFYREKPTAFALLPEWCRKPSDEYVDSKVKEGWARSTLDMIRSSITRFCNYLDSIGIHSFRDIDSSHIKQFNAHDKHKTPQGKNACNARIRKFLIYLGSHNYLANPMLFVSLSRTTAPKETIVVILTEEEMAELNDQLDPENQDSRLSLREKAMLLLGLKMGLRASDVVRLKFDDVNWNTASIRFVQKKTAVEVNLPMPPEVGNALFRYITEERGTKSTRNIFLSESAPHKPVGRAVCGNALHTALPERDVEGSGFHVTRKTYATNLLRKGVGARMVAEALGQRGTTSVHRYLSLDVERMKLCPLSLSECGVGGWNDEK